MTESRIIELLDNLRNNKFGRVPTTSKYMPNYIESISKSFSDIVYGTIKIKSASATSRRLDYIQVLQKWCLQESNHFIVDDDNVNCYIRAILNVYKQTNDKTYLDNKISLDNKTSLDKNTIDNKTIDNKTIDKRPTENAIDLDEDIVEEFLEALAEEHRQNPPQDFLTEIINFYKDLEDVAKETDKHLEEIVKFDQQMLDDCNFDYNIPKYTKANEDIEFFLHSFLRDDYLRYKEVDFEGKFRRDRFSEPGFRECQIHAAFGLLNLLSIDRNSTSSVKRNDASIVFKCMSSILKKLKSYDELKSFERDFLDHLFLSKDLLEDKNLLEDNLSKNKDPLKDIAVILLKNFPFIYEKPLLKLCTDTIKSQSFDIISLIEYREEYPMLKRIFECCRQDEEIKFSIRNMLNELFALCNYNQRLLIVVNYL